jgi:hypothetical protein
MTPPSEPVHVKALYRSAKALMGLGEWDESTRALDRAIELKPNDDVLEALRGEITTARLRAEKDRLRKSERDQHRLAHHESVARMLAESKISFPARPTFLPVDLGAHLKIDTNMPSPAALFPLPVDFDYKITVDVDSQTLEFPVILLFGYEERFDLIAAWNQTVSIKTMLTEMFDDPSVVVVYSVYVPTASGWTRLRVLADIMDTITRYGLAEDGVVRLWLVPSLEDSGERGDWTRKWLKNGVASLESVGK